MDGAHVGSRPADRSPVEFSALGLDDWLPELLPHFVSLSQAGRATVVVDDIVGDLEVGSDTQGSVVCAAMKRCVSMLSGSSRKVATADGRFTEIGLPLHRRDHHRGRAGTVVQYPRQGSRISASNRHCRMSSASKAVFDELELTVVCPVDEPLCP